MGAVSPRSADDPSARQRSSRLKNITFISNARWKCVGSGTASRRGEDEGDAESPSWGLGRSPNQTADDFADLRSGGEPGVEARQETSVGFCFGGVDGAV